MKDLVGVMVGRAAYENPWVLSDVDRRFYDDKNPGFTRRQILEKWAEFGEYILKHEDPNVHYPYLNKPIINLFCGEKHSVRWKRYLSDHSIQ